MNSNDYSMGYLLKVYTVTSQGHSAAWYCGCGMHGYGLGPNFDFAWQDVPAVRYYLQSNGAMSKALRILNEFENAVSVSVMYVYLCEDRSRYVKEVCNIRRSADE